MTENAVLLLQNEPSELKSVIAKIKHWGYQLQSIENAAREQVALLPINPQLPIEFYEGLIKDLRKKNNSCQLIAFFCGTLKVKTPQLFALGVHHLYRLPFDEDLLINKILELHPVQISNENLNWEHLAAVSVLDLSQKEKLMYDLFLFLPANKKIIHYKSPDVQIESKTFEKFKDNLKFPLFIKRTDLAKYRDHLSSKLGEAQNQLELQKKVTQLMTPFFTEDYMTEEEQKQFVQTLDSAFDKILPEKVQESVNHIKSLTYQKLTDQSHSSNVSVYCVIFGSLCGIENISDLKLGGFLHDIGLSDMPVEILQKPENQFSEQERAQYHLHPGNGKQEVENKKLKISQTALDMILYHHERLDGTGYPYKKKTEEIPLAAQVCALADEFDKMTSIREGCKTYTPREALMELGDKNIIAPDMYKKIVDGFINEKDQTSYKEIKSKAVDIKNPIKLKDMQKKIEKKPQTALNGDTLHMIEELKKYFQELHSSVSK